MKAQLPKLIAITGGSGSGKTWVAQHLQKLFPTETLVLTLDNFYRDRSKLPAARRDKLNFDHPRALDWPLVERALRLCRAGQGFQVPVYDFSTHTRLSSGQMYTPKPLVLIEGLWLLRRPAVRNLLDFSIYLDCSSAVRLQRRLQRDTLERNRSVLSIKQQFRQTVDPMHKRFVAPQVRFADLVLPHPVGERQIKELAHLLSALLRGATCERLRKPSLLPGGLSNQLFQP